MRGRPVGGRGERHQRRLRVAMLHPQPRPVLVLALDASLVDVRPQDQRVAADEPPVERTTGAAGARARVADPRGDPRHVEPEVETHDGRVALDRRDEQHLVEEPRERQPADRRREPRGDIRRLLRRKRFQHRVAGRVALRQIIGVEQALLDHRERRSGLAPSDSEVAVEAEQQPLRGVGRGLGVEDEDRLREPVGMAGLTLTALRLGVIGLDRLGVNPEPELIVWVHGCAAGSRARQPGMLGVEWPRPPQHGVCPAGAGVREQREERAQRAQRRREAFQRVAITSASDGPPRRRAVPRSRARGSCGIGRRGACSSLAAPATWCDSRRVLPRATSCVGSVVPQRAHATSWTCRRRAPFRASLAMGDGSRGLIGGAGRCLRIAARPGDPAPRSDRGRSRSGSPGCGAGQTAAGRPGCGR